jgi:hypothetical protein
MRKNVVNPLLTDFPLASSVRLKDYSTFVSVYTYTVLIGRSNITGKVLKKES